MKQKLHERSILLFHVTMKYIQQSQSHLLTEGLCFNFFLTYLAQSYVIPIVSFLLTSLGMFSRFFPYLSALVHNSSWAILHRHQPNTHIYTVRVDKAYCTSACVSVLHGTRLSVIRIPVHRLNSAIMEMILCLVQFMLNEYASHNIYVHWSSSTAIWIILLH